MPGDMDETITGKVAAVIDETTLVLNAGSADGVKLGMVFSIFAEYQEILDPDSGDSLGKWEMVKAQVVVEHVQERVCTVRSTLLAINDQPGTLSAMMVQHSFGNFGKGGEQRERLEVRAADAAGRPQSQPIAVGDGARLVLPDADGDGDAQVVADAAPAASSNAVSDQTTPEASEDVKGAADQHVAEA